MTNYKLKVKNIPITLLNGVYLKNEKLTQDGIRYIDTIIRNFLNIKEYVADKMLKDYNENWIDIEDGDIMLDEKAFIDNLINPSILIYDRSIADVCFDECNMFGGHWIVVSLENHTPVNARIMG